MVKYVNIYYLESQLKNDDIGIGIAVSNKKTNCWSLWIYMGNATFIILYNNTTLNLTTFTLNYNKTITIKELKSYPQLEYCKLKCNIFKTDQYVLISNLLVISSLTEGDIIEFDRGYYYHACIVTDVSKMLIAHRYGENFVTNNYKDMIDSIIGNTIKKTNIVEDNIFDISFNNKFYKMTNKYDKLYNPKNKKDILSFVKSKLGTIDKYSFSNKNCQHFVSECRNGHEYSPGIEIIYILINVSIIISIITAGIIISTFLYNNL